LARVSPFSTSKRERDGRWERHVASFAGEDVVVVVVVVCLNRKGIWKRILSWDLRGDHVSHAGAEWALDKTEQLLPHSKEYGDEMGLDKNRTIVAITSVFSFHI
jgi:hypothetical protein